MAGSKILSRVGIVIVFALLASCGRVQITPEISIDQMSAEEIYQAGERELERGKDERAASYFGEIERLFPYSDWASRGLVMQAYTLHKDGKYTASRAAAERYLSFYPRSGDADWAQYLVALSYYDQIFDIGRDQGLTINALRELRKVIETYPESEYADEARPRFDLAFDHLAGKEMEIGRYYLGKGEYTAAIGRFKTVVEDFETTRHTPEALFRLVEAYVSLGLTTEAQAAAAILQQEFAGEDWTNDALALLGQQGVGAAVTGNGWLARIYRQTVQGDWL